MHWRSPSKVDYIKAGLDKFINLYPKLGITSIAFPALGCGNGELDFRTQIKPIMEHYLKDLPISTFIYPGGHQTTPPEHKDIDRIERWLRSKPDVLSFDEVWRDIVDILNRRDTFTTFTKGNAYTARALTNPIAINIESAGKTYRLNHDVLVAVWPQIRDYGFTHRHIVPDHYRISYLLPIFAELPYTRRVDSSTSLTNLSSNPTIGIQIAPYATTRWENQDIFSYAVDASQI